MKVYILKSRLSNFIYRVFSERWAAEAFITDCKRRTIEYDEAFDRYCDDKGELPEDLTDAPFLLSYYDIVEYEVH